MQLSLRSFHAEQYGSKILTRVLILNLIFSGFLGCATNSPKRLSVEEKVKVEKAIGTELSRNFEKKLKFKQDVEVSVYLRKIAERLMAATPEFNDSAIGLFVIQNFRGVWRNFSLPGNRIYLAAGLLKKMEYENQLAAVIAMELGHLLKKDVLWRVRQNMDSEDIALSQPLVPASVTFDQLILPEPSQLKTVEYFGPRGVFTFNQQVYLAAASEAVGILYRAGFDPRGLCALWETYRARAAHSPYDNKTLEKLIQKTRRVIAENAPLRNPVVRSPEFLEIQKRIKKL